MSKHCSSEPFFLSEISPFTTCPEGFTVIHNYNLATIKIIAYDNLLLPKFLAYNKIQAQNKGMFYQCNWTAWLQRVLLLKLSDHYIVPNTIFSLPFMNFPLPLSILFPCMLLFLTVLRSLLCPNPCLCFFLLCALPLFLLPPVLSSHGWCAGGGSYAL